MRILVTGVCGFVGSRLALALQERIDGIEVIGVDNLLRPGSETNRERLTMRGVRYFHGDVRLRSDVESLPPCDWVIDAAAHPSVLAGVDGRSSTRQLVEHNLLGTINLVEYCRDYRAGLLLLSTSRVYSIRDLAALPVCEIDSAFSLSVKLPTEEGISNDGINERFPVRQPISLYGSTKLSSEIMAIEFGKAFNLPVWINRCGVLAGAGQFGTAEQGIFSYWLHAHAARLPLRYIGFGGRGYQVRDALHPDDLADLISVQLRHTPPEDAIYNVGGGIANSMSLAQLTSWCNQRFGLHEPLSDDRPRAYDIPWIVMDNARVKADLGWSPQRAISWILDEIARHVEDHPDWLRRSAAV